MPYENRYHANAGVEWRQGMSAAQRKAFEGKRLVGLEIEHEVARGKTRAGLITQLDAINETVADKFLMERDGSLDGERGVEIILPPIPYRSIFSKNSLAKRILDVAKEYGADETKEGVGMHVNLNVAGLDTDHVGAAVGSFHQLKPLGVVIAGRESVNWAPYRLFKSVEHYAGLGSKMNAAWYRNHRPVIEVRANRSAVDWELARDRVRYCTAVLDFSQEMFNDVREVIKFKKKNEGVDEKDTLEYWIKFTKEQYANRWNIYGYRDAEDMARRFLEDHRRGSGAAGANMPKNGNPTLVKMFGEWCRAQKSKSLKSVVERIRGGLDAAKAA